MDDLERRIGHWYENIAQMSPENLEARRDVELVIAKLDDGQVRVAEIDDHNDVVVHEWVKQAILLLFRLREMTPIEVGPFEYFDKLDLKSEYARRGVRVVPGASARRGSYLRGRAWCSSQRIHAWSRWNSTRPRSPSLDGWSPFFALTEPARGGRYAATRPEFVRTYSPRGR